MDEEAAAANNRDELHLGIKVKEISETEKEAQLKESNVPPNIGTRTNFVQ